LAGARRDSSTDAVEVGLDGRSVDVSIQRGVVLEIPLKVSGAKVPALDVQELGDARHLLTNFDLGFMI